jgi:lipopolysaccharide export system permease protein
MRLHDRYLFRELLTPLAFCLGGFLVFWISFFFFTELETIQENKLHLLDTVEYAAAMLPGFFVMVLPITLLLAMLYALTHHARHNEITALRAAGVSLWRLSVPYFIVGLLATGIYFLLNEVAVPKCADWSEQILSRYVKNGNDNKVKTRFINKDFRIARARRTWHFSEYDSVTTEVSNPNVNWNLADGSWKTLKAARAVRTNGVWTFFEAQLIAQSGLHGKAAPLFSTNEIAMPEFDETPKQILVAIKFSDVRTLRGSRGADIPLSELREYLRNNPDVSGDDGHFFFTKYYGRLAAPWTCLVVVLIAIPFGAAPGRRNLFFGVAGSIFIGFAFFILQQVGLALGAGGTLPGWLAAWLPNIIFAVIGIILTARIR